MAFSSAMKFKTKITLYKTALVVFGCLLLLESVQRAFCETFTINTNNPPTIYGSSGKLFNGIIQNKTFRGPNGESWDHDVAVFYIPEANKSIFNNGNTVKVTGNNSLSLNTTGDLTISTPLDISGQEVKDEDTSVFLLGGFVRRSNSCCVLGAGPGAAFSFHGAGHGGRGGGYYQNHNTSRFYSWDYHNVNYLLGGSTSTVLFESKAGSGGGAIEIIASNGILKIDAPISADGFSSKNTSEEHCAGGSSGGLIRLKGNTVLFTENGELSAKGGNGGLRTTTLQHCSDGGGGGVIQVFSTFDNNTRKQFHVNGGKGIDNGEAGVVFQGVFFNDGELNINTSDCSMKWLSILVHQGVLHHYTYRTTDNKITISYTVCSFTFKSSLHIGSGAKVAISGKHSMKIVSERGNIELMTSFDLSGTASVPGSKSLGAFVMTNLSEKSVGPGNVTRCNAIELFANDFETLLGGSICSTNSMDTQVMAVGGGAIELVAKVGTIVIGNKIKVDGFSDNKDAGATGGLIRLIGKKVHLKDAAFFSAKSSDSVKNLASGGIVQIKSDMDIEGLCETKFHVTGVRNGLVNVMVSALESYQVQFIQEGTLLINTTLCIWVHRTHNNYSMAYSQFGSITNVTSNDITFSICSFNFKAPIIVNGSANVTLTGENALSINSEQGIYIGVDLVIDSGKVAAKSRYLGGYCVNETSLVTTGNGPGRGQPNTNAGGGHGGRGGLFFEANNGHKYGYTYGLDPFLLIGGSTGISNQSIAAIEGCGGGAIRISSGRNLTINGDIRANGYSATFFNNEYPHGGSSGGTIYLEARQVILGESASLEAKGSDAAGPGSLSTGGGGGGVIKINSTNPLVGKRPDPAYNTRGGQGLVPGESGLVIIVGIEDAVYRENRNPVVEIPSNFSGCYQINAAELPPRKRMLAHLARPKTCLGECITNNTLFAVIRKEFCFCLDNNASFVVKNSSICVQPCSATFNYSCGGANDDIYSVYITGVTLPVTPPPTTTEPTPTTMLAPTTRPFDVASTAFTELNQVNITQNNAQKVVQDLANLTQTTELNGGDTLTAVNIINKLASGDVLSPKNRNETQQAGQAIVEIASRLLGSKNEASWRFLETRNTTTEKTSSYNVLEAIEKIAVDLGSGLDKEENVTLETEHVALGIIKKNMDNFTGDTYPHYDDLSEKWQFEDKLFIPPETTNAFKTRGDRETTVYFVLYNRINSALKSNLEKGTVINSRVISVGFDRDLVNPLPKPVVISFTKYQMENFTSPVCSFLDFSNKTSGDWSNRGVKLTSFEDNKIECESNHLTNFAVLMQVKKFEISKAHTQALQMITYIGCGISLFGLALTLATFLSLETLASERTSIHKNLVVAIGLAQIIFLAGIDVVYNPIACKIVALCLHYLYMAAFTWMCCEGLHLYTKVIEVFSSEASKMKYYYMLGWGVPLIIVIISAASRIDGYSTETACWISIDHGLIWAFVGPVLVIMCINFVVMVMVIKVILASVTSIQNPGNTSQVKAGLKGMVVLLPLLGLTWVFGLMAVNEKTIAFQYIFAILNSLQGLFIFAFHCIGNSEVRVAYKRLHEKRTLAKSLPEHSLSSGNHHKNVEEFNKRRMNSRETNSTGDEDIIVTKAIRSVSDVKLTGAADHVAMQTFGDADSGRWSLNCPSPEPPCIVFQSATNDPRGNPRSAPDILDGSKTTPRKSYRSDGDYPTDRHRYRGGNQALQHEE